MSTTESEPKISEEVRDHRTTSNGNFGGEKQSLSLQSPDPAPDGGLRAWLVAAGAFCIYFSVLGYTNAFGVFQQYYLTHQLRDESPDKIAWIGSFAAFAQFATGIITGPLFDRYGHLILRPALVLYVFSIMMTSLCNTYWQFMLAQGVLMGISMGFLGVPAIAAVSQYFDERRAAALGIAISGSSIGGVVIPIALGKMLNSSSLGFGWSVRIIGFLTIPLMAFAGLTVKSRLPRRTSNLFITSAFKEKKYLLLIVALFFNLLGMFTPIFFLPTYATTRGMDPTLASYLLAIVNAASFFGRVIPGVLADKLGRVNMFAFAGFSTGIVITCMTTATSTAGLIIYAIFVGFSSGTIVSAGSAAMSVCAKDPRDIGSYMGMGMAIGSVAILTGPPINGALVESYGGYLQLSIFSGVMCIAGGCTALLARIISRHTPDA